MNNILVIGAHFDDTDLAVGGTCAELASLGKKVYKLVLTDNVTNFKQKKIVVDYEHSKSANLSVCEILGCKEVPFIPEKCNELKYSSALMQRVEKIIFDYEIDTVFIHADGDFNQDHNAAHQICLTAARHCDNIFLFNSNGYLKTKPFNPNFFVDITDFVSIQKKALSVYDSAHDRFGRLFSTAIDRDSIFGYSVGCEYAEGFIAIKYKI